MSLVIEESEEISKELVSCLLQSVRKDRMVGLCSFQYCWFLLEFHTPVVQNEMLHSFYLLFLVKLVQGFK
jgi:hypothetical protein